jgi:hypothetical protein
MARIDVRRNGVLHLVIELSGEEAAQLAAALLAAGKTIEPPYQPVPIPPPSANGPVPD